MTKKKTTNIEAKTKASWICTSCCEPTPNGIVTCDDCQARDPKLDTLFRNYKDNGPLKKAHSWPHLKLLRSKTIRFFRHRRFTLDTLRCLSDWLYENGVPSGDVRFHIRASEINLRLLTYLADIGFETLESQPSAHTAHISKLFPKGSLGDQNLTEFTIYMDARRDEKKSVKKFALDFLGETIDPTKRARALEMQFKRALGKGRISF